PDGTAWQPSPTQHRAERPATVSRMDSTATVPYTTSCGTTSGRSLRQTLAYFVGETCHGLPTGRHGNRPQDNIVRNLRCTLALEEKGKGFNSWTPTVTCRARRGRRHNRASARSDTGTIGFSLKKTAHSAHSRLYSSDKLCRRSPNP